MILRLFCVLGFLCSVDYRALNDISSKNESLLPLLEVFGPLYIARIFSKLDLRNAYHLVRIREGDE